MIPRAPTHAAERAIDLNAPADPHAEWQEEQRRLWRVRARDYTQLDWVGKQDFMGAMIGFCALDPSWHALDVGTGPGNVAAALLPHVAQVTGIDITPGMIEQARASHADKPNMAFAVDDAEVLASIADNSVDIAVARMVFHHIDDCHSSLTQIRRKLKPGGSCVICEGVPPDHLTRQRYVEIFELKEKRHTFSEAELINLFDHAGYADIVLKPFFMRQVSLNNWLAHSALPEENIREITRLHTEADDHFKRVYRLNERDGDVFMDWKFIMIKAYKEFE